MAENYSRYVSDAQRDGPGEDFVARYLFHPLGRLTNKFSFPLGDAEWNGDTERDASDPRRMLFVEKPGAVQYPNPLCKLHRPGTEGLLSLLILENPLRGVQRTKV